MLVGLGSSVWQCFLTECAGCNRYVKVGGDDGEHEVVGGEGGREGGVGGAGWLC